MSTGWCCSTPNTKELCAWLCSTVCRVQFDHEQSRLDYACASRTGYRLVYRGRLVLYLPSVIVDGQGSLMELDVVEYRTGGDDGHLELGSYIGDGKVHTSKWEILSVVYETQRGATAWHTPLSP